MANVNVNEISVPRIARNKRIYDGNTGTYITNQNNSINEVAISKAIVPFINSDTPRIDDYSEYTELYGQFPIITLYAIDESGNRVERTEKPYFILNVENLITSVSFGNVGELLTGFITISK